MRIPRATKRNSSTKIWITAAALACLAACGRTAEFPTVQVKAQSQGCEVLECCQAPSGFYFLSHVDCVTNGGVTQPDSSQCDRAAAPVCCLEDGTYTPRTRQECLARGGDASDETFNYCPEPLPPIEPSVAADGGAGPRAIDGGGLEAGTPLAADGGGPGAIDGSTPSDLANGNGGYWAQAICCYDGYVTWRATLIDCVTMLPTPGSVMSFNPAVDCP